MTPPGTGAGSPPAPGSEHWLGQDDLPWNILLVVSLDEVPDRQVLLDRLVEFAHEHRWPPPSGDAVVEGTADDLLPALSALTDVAHPVSVGRTPTGLVVRAHHAYVDGLGLLAVLRALIGSEVVSGAAGLPDRPRRSTAVALATRLVEVVVHPPARVAGSAVPDPALGLADVFAAVTLPRVVRTVDLAHAAVQAVSARNAAMGVRADRIALAVGVSTLGGADLRAGDHSGFLRFTGAERLSRSALERALDTAPLQVGGTAQGAAARRTSGLIRWASRTFAARLGSTVLVSHLGRVDAAGLGGAAFYPLTGGGSGVCVGAVTVEESTTVTIRGRGRQHSASGLEELLSELVKHLG